MGRRYRIGQAAEKLGLAPSVLRYWESEFPQLEPVRTRKGQRLYTDEHLALVERIRAMVHGEGLTIEGARRRLEQEALARADGAGAAGRNGAGTEGTTSDGSFPAPGASGTLPDPEGARTRTESGAPAVEGPAGDATLRREMVRELLALKRLLGD